MNPDRLNSMFTLMLKLKWISAERFRDGTRSLIEDCENIEELHATEYILGKLKYCTSNDLEEGAIEAAESIVGGWQLNPDDTLLVGVAEASKTCGSTAYVRAIETRLPRNWNDSIHTTFDSAFRHRNNKKNIIIVDDFVGTGEKILTRIERLRRNPNTSSYVIYVISFAGMDSGMTRVADKLDNNVHVHVLLEKCFAKIEPVAKSTVVYQSMAQLEKKIFTLPGKFSLGYQQSEASFYLEGFNIPNNNFPILWWDTYVDKSERKPLFRRR